ncbi:hypothetical protein LCGC14_2570950 [marine sediment metagenome]|uniref:Uncharacterized protein n=1 Tax=marine sediment metagenome TaxID=412755 RepID=A0A0F9DA57_9ZZZZ
MNRWRPLNWGFPTGTWWDKPEVAYEVGADTMYEEILKLLKDLQKDLKDDSLVSFKVLYELLGVKYGNYNKRT